MVRGCLCRHPLDHAFEQGKMRTKERCEMKRSVRKLLTQAKRVGKLRAVCVSEDAYAVLARVRKENPGLTYRRLMEIAIREAYGD